MATLHVFETVARSRLVDDLRALSEARRRSKRLGCHFVRTESQRLELELLTLTKNQRALERVAQLPDVARPSVIRQRITSSCGQANAGLTLVTGDAFKDVLGDRHDVFLARAQRRELEHDRIDPKQKIATKARNARHLDQVAMGCRDQAHVGFAGLHLAQAAIDFVFEHLEQLRLNRQIEIADFVEEQAALVGKLEQSAFVGTRPGKCASAMTK